MNEWGFTTWNPILVYGKDPYLENCLGSRADSIRHIESSEKNGHPCPKPITLWRKVLDRVSVKDTDIVLDPFMGSGTTAEACIIEKMNFIGSELSKNQVEYAKKRYGLRISQPCLFCLRITFSGLAKVGL
jgi:DNA modification methylase